MAYAKVIVIFGAFAKKNEKKITFENRDQMTKVVTFLSVYPKGDEKNHRTIHRIHMYSRACMMRAKKGRARDGDDFFIFCFMNHVRKRNQRLSGKGRYQRQIREDRRKMTYRHRPLYRKIG